MIDRKKASTGERPATRVEIARHTDGGGDRTDATTTLVASPALLELVKVLARYHVRRTLDQRNQDSQPATPKAARG